MAGDLAYKHEAILRDLLVMCSVRGEDSTGIVAVEKRDAAFTIVKQVGSPYELFNDTRFKAALNTHKHSAFIGHCRKATHGVVNKPNAHPFECGHIAGVHNGTLRGTWQAHFKDVLGHEPPVDSLGVFQSIEAYGVADTIAQLEGAWALVWYDSDRDSINFLRNSERPLWYCYTPDLKQIFWASEVWMLQGALGRDGRAIELAKDEKGFSYWQMPTDAHFEWEIGLGSKPLVLRGEPTTIKGKEPVVHSTHRVPFSWERKENQPTFLQIEARKTVADPFLTPRERIETPAASTTTTTTTDVLSQGDLPKTGSAGSSVVSSPSPRPTLTLVQASKSAGSEQSGSTTPPATLDDNLDGLFDNEVRGYMGKVLNQSDYAACSKHGCAWCEQDVDFNDAAAGGISFWLSDDRFVCTTCANSDSLQSVYGVN